MDPQFGIILLVGAAVVILAALIGAVWDRRHHRAETLLPAEWEQQRNRGFVRYHIDVQDSISG